MLLFSLDPDALFAKSLAAALELTISPHEERVFPDGERKLRPLVDPHGADVHVVYSLHGGPVDSPHDKLCRLLMFLSTLKSLGAARLTAVVPYLAYARKDQQTKPYDPVGLKCVAQLLEAVGVARLIVLEPHNVAAFQNAFRCCTVHLAAHEVFGAWVPELAPTGRLVVASPDPGGVRRVQLWREALEVVLRRSVGFAMMDKRRSGGVLSGGRLVAGEVEDATVLLLDDLVASGETLQRTALSLRNAGASNVIGFAAHGLFVGTAPQVLAGEGLSQLVVTDSVPPFRLPQESVIRRKLRVVSAAPLFAEAVRAFSASRWP